MINNDLAKKHIYFNNKFFGKWAQLYDYEKHFLFPIRKKAARFLSLKSNAKIIDVATGTGAQAYELAKLGLEVTGVDLSPEMLKQARKKLGDSLKLKFLHSDATQLPFNDNEFDAASISWGLHDMPYEIELTVLREMKRVTKKGGPILIVDYMEPRRHIIARFSHQLIKLYETPNYVHFINRGLESLLEEVKLRIFRFTDFLGIIQIAVVLNNK